jgi:uncharacterized protein YqjF (DUF2071 family)
MGAPWVMRMRWVDLLFAHWPMPPEVLRPLIPPGLDLDLFDGDAWLGIVPFRMEDVAPHGLPAPPFAGAFPELNVRTYVRRRGIGGVWFLSLDAGSRVAVEGARLGFHLPYFRASMAVSRTEEGTTYRSTRADRRGPPATFQARYRAIGPAAPVAPDSLAGWLTDRRGLYAADGSGRLWWSAIRHDPWVLGPAEAEIERETMASSHGLTLPAMPPLLHHAERVDVQAWWPRRLVEP